MATIRSGEPTPDAVTSLWKDGYLQRFDLAPPSTEQSIALVESVLGGTLEEKICPADIMWTASGGNPLDSRLDRAGTEALVALRFLALCQPPDLDALVELAGEGAVFLANLPLGERLARSTFEHRNGLCGGIAVTRGAVAGATRRSRGLPGTVQSR